MRRLFSSLCGAAAVGLLSLTAATTFAQPGPPQGGDGSLCRATLGDTYTICTPMSSSCPMRPPPNETQQMNCLPNLGPPFAEPGYCGCA